MDLLRVFVCLVLIAPACASDAIDLARGPLGPASYDVELEVSGDPTLPTGSVEAQLAVAKTDRGARITLTVDRDPVVVEVRRLSDGRLHLETVQGVSPISAGEADLASLIGQLDPPLAPGEVRMGERWSQVQRIATESLSAALRSDLRITGFRRVAGGDAARIEGVVTGELRATGEAGTYTGTVEGRTRIDWMLGEGRLGAGRTELVWTIPDAGAVTLVTLIEPS